MTEWFARRDLTEASADQKRVVQKVSALLDQLQPARLDPAQQVVESVRGETWVKLRHDSEPSLGIEFVLSDRWVNFYGVMGHDEAYSVGSEPSDSWESETIEILANLLEAEFTIDTYSLQGKPWRTVLTVGGSDPLTSTEVHSWLSALPLRRWAKHTGSRYATFECRGVRPSA